MRRLIVLSLCLTLAGCSSLIVREDDSAMLVAGKILTRTLMAVPTIGISEGAMLDLKDAERNKAWREQRLPQTEGDCRAQWRSYVQDHQLKIISESMRDLALTALTDDYIGGAEHVLGVTGLFEPSDPLQAEWKQTLARDPQAALLSQCAKRFGGIQRFFPSP